MSNKRRRTDAGTIPGALEQTGLPGSTNDDAQSRTESRKSAAACSACRKQKIRCEMRDDQTVCVRCRRRGLDCILHQPIRAVNGDLRQLNLVRTDLATLFATLAGVCEHLELAPPQSLVSSHNSIPQGLDNGHALDLDAEDEGDACELSPPGSPSAARAPMDTFIDTARADGAATSGSPASSRRRGNDATDLVSRGLIKLETARLLVQRYLDHLDHYLYGLAGRYKNLDQLKKSPTLLAAICAVSAFNDPLHQGVFEVCNREYRNLVSTSLFEKRDSEYIRALCIGSFWLPDASRILLSDALRRAADARLPYRFRNFVHPENEIHSVNGSGTGMDEMRDKVRLWYLLFVSDQHSSILHNRDCIVRRDMEILEARDGFLSMSGATNQDVRLISQVSLLLIMGDIRDVFGSEVILPVPKTLKVQLTHFSQELEKWFSKFAAIFEPDPSIGDFPMTGLQLHYQFSKVYLGHHVFRGLDAEPIQPHFLSTAKMAYTAARAIFEMFLHNAVLRDNLLGVPHYFHIMISFAGHFMLDVCEKHHDQLAIAIHEDLGTMKAALVHCKKTCTLPQHPLSRMTAGLLRKLSECTTSMGYDSILSQSPFQQFDFQLGEASMPGTTLAGYPHGIGTYATTSDVNFQNDMIFPDFDPFTLQDTSQFSYLV